MHETPDSKQADTYEAFLVRLWHGDAGTPWRASATRVKTGEETCFASLERLYVFLHQYAQDGAGGEA